MASVDSFSKLSQTRLQSTPQCIALIKKRSEDVYRSLCFQTSSPLTEEKKATYLTLLQNQIDFFATALLSQTCSFSNVKKNHVDTALVSLRKLKAIVETNLFGKGELEPRNLFIELEKEFLKLKEEVTQKEKICPDKLAERYIELHKKFVNTPYDSVYQESYMSIRLLAIFIAEELSKIPATRYRIGKVFNAPRGIFNMSNDCAFIAIYQLLQTNFLRKYLRDCLPQELNSYKGKPKFSTELRAEASAFSDSPDFGINTQEDANEILGFLTRKVEFNSSPKPEAIHLQADNNTTFSLRLLFSTLSEIFSGFIKLLVSFFPSLSSALSQRALPPLPDTASTLSSGSITPDTNRNPLFFNKITTRIYKAGNFPKAIKTHDYFGGSSNKTVTIEEDAMVSLSLEKDQSNNVNRFSKLFEKGFLGKGSHEKSLKVTEEKSGRTYQATYTESSQFETAPNHLLLSFKRFEYDRERKCAVKISDNIEGIPETLHLNKKFTRDGSKKSYELTGFVTHLGHSQVAGHYISYVKKDNGSWYCCNDESVSKVSEDEVMLAVKQAYIVSYSEK